VSKLKRLLCYESQHLSQSNEKSLVEFDYEKAVSNCLGTQSTFNHLDFEVDRRLTYKEHTSKLTVVEVAVEVVAVDLVALVVAVAVSVFICEGVAEVIIVVIVKAVARVVVVVVVVVVTLQNGYDENGWKVKTVEMVGWHQIASKRVSTSVPN